MKKQIVLSLMLSLSLFVTACDDDDTSPATTAEFLESYSQIAYLSYKDSLDAAEEFAANVTAFGADTTQANHTALQEEWTAMRRPYLQTEAFRFSGTPIDTENYFEADGVEELEGLLNAWPLDEAYIDSFLASSEEISTANLDPFNGADAGAISGDEEDAEKNIIVGYHAIEYMLWGQDENTTGPGERDVTYFTDGTNGTRRLAYLKAIADILVEHLTLITEAWNPDVSDNFRAELVAGGDDDLSNIITGLASFAKAEWGGERLVGLTVGDQEDEHSCFSDTTFQDFYYDAQGVLNIYRGTYTDVDGTTYEGVGLTDLNDDSELDSTIDDALVASRDQYDAEDYNYNFDELISDDPAGELNDFRSNRAVIQGLADSLTELAGNLGITLGTVEEGAPDPE